MDKRVLLAASQRLKRTVLMNLFHCSLHLFKEELSTTISKSNKMTAYLSLLNRLFCSRLRTWRVWPLSAAIMPHCSTWIMRRWPNLIKLQNLILITFLNLKRVIACTFSWWQFENCDLFVCLYLLLVEQLNANHNWK